MTYHNIPKNYNAQNNIQFIYPVILLLILHISTASGLGWQGYEQHLKCCLLPPASMFALHTQPADAITYLCSDA